MDVLSCSREASTWALDAWTNSSAWRALCDVDHGRHKLIRIIMVGVRVCVPCHCVRFHHALDRTSIASKLVRCCGSFAYCYP